MAEQVEDCHLAAWSFEDKLGLTSCRVFLLDAYLQVFELWEVSGDRNG